MYLLVAVLLVIEFVLSQPADRTIFPSRFPDRWKSVPSPEQQPLIQSDSVPSFYKRKGEWQKIIDEYWGPGDTYTQKLYIFDSYVSHVRANFPAFFYSKLNWDSVATHYRSQIRDSTSRGAFHAILQNVAYSLDEFHAYAGDDTVWTTPMNPGTPIVNLPWITYDVRHFGAALTPLPDSSLLVYKVVPNHPLGLQPGDRVIGYEGVTWPQLADELIAAGVATDLQLGGCPSAKWYYRMAWAGMAWHLFDTLDVIKYDTGQLVHFPTKPLATLSVSEPIIQCDQLPVPGVPMPSNDQFTGNVSYGIVEGTNIGYIYIRHHQLQKISTQFDAAVVALSNTDGLIIDLRLDIGGLRGGIEKGIGRLANFGTKTFKFLKRSSASDLHDMVETTIPWDLSIPLDVGTWYEPPIAVLLGPYCYSRGDESARLLSFLPNVRFFGKSPVGTYAWPIFSYVPYIAGYSLSCSDVMLADIRYPDIQIWDKEFPVDEYVWLSPDDVAKGEDSVVKRALEWISNVTHVHDVSMNPAGEYSLSENYPNPFNASTTIEFTLQKSCFVTLKVYNMLGEAIATLITEQRPAGIHLLNWDASGLASGVYLYRLEAGDPSTSFPNKSGQAGQGFVQSKKLILMR